MNTLLSIVIPRYRETEKELFPLLSSIHGQIGIDHSVLEVIVATDGKENAPLEKEFFGLFDFPATQVTLETNIGPGAARQAGLDAASGKYVMFCDADDTLHNVGVLQAMTKEADASAADLVSSSWLEEIPDSHGGFVYLEHPKENTWMHGKLFHRLFLLDNGIRFHDTLRVHEDSYFLSIAADFAKEHRHMPITSYVWKYHADSITRRNKGAYTYESMPEFIRACTLAWNVIEPRHPDRMQAKVIQFILYQYFICHLPNWQAKEHAHQLRTVEEAFAKAIAPFLHYWKSAPRQAVLEAYNTERQRSFAGSMEQETLFEWLCRLNIESSHDIPAFQHE